MNNVPDKWRPERRLGRFLWSVIKAAANTNGCLVLPVLMVCAGAFMHAASLVAGNSTGGPAHNAGAACLFVVIAFICAYLLILAVLGVLAMLSICRDACRWVGKKWKESEDQQPKS